MVLLLACLTACETVRAAEYVWWEGEKPLRTNFPRQTWLSPNNFEHKRHVFSEGDWLTNSGKRGPEEALAVYQVRVPRSGTYSLWARKFWKHGPFRWRLDRGQWQVCGRDVALADSVDIRKHVCVNWVFLGEVKAAGGTRQFELRLLAKQGEETTCGFDCFVLSPTPFAPRGKLKPGEASGKAEEGFFAFEPAPDHFGDDALLDLRYLNEKEAGEKGFVKHDGLHFKLGSGESVRFWGVNVSNNNTGQDRAAVDYLARKLAKLGVNMVRFHGPIFDKGGDPAKVDNKLLDNLHYLVAALKKQGIYSTISFYFPLWFDVKPHYGLPGYEATGNKKPFALLYFQPRMQEIYRSWARALLSTKNPYTGRPLARDPAVAIVEVINEDSFFFWTFGKANVPEPHWRRLEGIFGKWLLKRYGSLEKALAAWGGVTQKDDDLAQGRVGIFDAWFMTGDGLGKAPRNRKRICDQVRFLAEQQRTFYASMVDYFKQDLGYGGLVSCSNWHVSDPVMLDALERYTYTAGDVIDRHGYFGGGHKGEGASYSVRVGHTYKDRAAVFGPEHLPIQFHQIDGYPHTITEIGWPSPNRFRADMTFLASAYGALQGVDGFYFFAVGSNFLNDGGIRKFPVSCPTVAWTFPAAALLYRLGLVEEAEEAVHEVIRLEDLFAMKGSAAIAAQALDELRKADVPSGARLSGPVSRIDPLAFYVGRVMRSFGDSPRRSRQKNLVRYIDHEGKVVKSLDKSLVWDYGKGVVTLNAPRGRGAVGALSKAGALKLDDVTIECRNEFASILVVSMDDKPIARSKKILIQAMTEEKPFGFRTENGRITDLGGSPFNVRKIDAAVTLKLKRAGTKRPKVIALDHNGYPTKKKVETSGSGGPKPLTVRLAEDTIYHVIQR